MLTDVTAIKLNFYYSALKFNIHTGGNLLVLGRAGVGKTECAQQAIEAEGYEAIYINLSVLEYPDLVGLQTVTFNPETGMKHVEYAAPKFLPLVPKHPGMNHKKKVIIFDEIDKAKEELQNPLLELLQFRTINGVPVDAQAFILTGNLPDEGAFSRPISHALTNRCMVYRLEHEFSTWHTWAVSVGINPLILGFLSQNPQYLEQAINTDDPTAYCRSSPRSWTWASRDLDATQDGGKITEDSINFQTLLLAGRVGTSAALQFRVWLEHYRDIEAPLKDLCLEGKYPDNFTFDKTLVLALAACNAVSQYCRRDVSESKDWSYNLENLVKNVFGWLGTLTPDVQVCATKSTMSLSQIEKFKLTEFPIFMQVFLAVRDILEPKS